MSQDRRGDCIEGYGVHVNETTEIFVHGVNLDVCGVHGAS